MSDMERKAGVRMASVNPLVYRINVAADKLGVSRATIYRLVNSGHLELVKIGPRSSAITAASITAHLGKGRSAPPAPG